MMSNPRESWLVRSDGLHSRVQRFIQAATQNREEFEQLALEIAHFQAEQIPGFARLIDARHSRLDSLESVPAIPVEAFRLARIAVHPPEVDAVRYVTSGTTSGQPGIHVMRRTDTYRSAAITGARQALLPHGTDRALVAALLPAGNTNTSSLAAMAQMFMDEFDPVSEASGTTSEMPARWLLTEQGIDISLVAAHLERAKSSNRPLIIAATSFALVQFLDALGDKRLDCWPHTIVMPTGGFKGKVSEILAPELRTRVATAFGIDERNCVGEYGMTELSSQLYEGGLPGGTLRGEPGIYIAPAWLDVCPVDPETLLPVPHEELGIARFIDLANVDSALCIVTQDMIRRKHNGIELLGRRQNAMPRGCSLSTEEWFLSNVSR